MKTLIEESIKIRGIGSPTNKTIFNIEREIEKNDTNYYNIKLLSGRRMILDFGYIEDEDVKIDTIQLWFPCLEEQEMKELIVEQINIKLGNEKN